MIWNDTVLEKLLDQQFLPLSNVFGSNDMQQYWNEDNEEQHAIKKIKKLKKETKIVIL